MGLELVSLGYNAVELAWTYEYEGDYRQLYVRKIYLRNGQTHKGQTCRWAVAWTLQEQMVNICSCWGNPMLLTVGEYPGLVGLAPIRGDDGE